MLTVLSKLDVNINPANIEAFHWLKSNNKGTKAILKLSRRKDSYEIRRVRSKLKTTDLKPIGITTLVYINDSLCFYYNFNVHPLKLFHISLISKSPSQIIRC